MVEDYDAHNLTFDHDDAPFVIDRDAARVLKYIRSKLAHELPVLVVDLYLVRGRAFRDDYVAGCSHDGHAVRVEQLAVTLAAFPKLKLESTFFVEDLNAVVVGVRDDDVVLGVHCYPGGFGELAFHDAELTELAMVDHLLALDLALGREDRVGHQLRGYVEHGVGVVDRGERVRVVDGPVLEDAVRTVRPLLVRVDGVQVEITDACRERPQAISAAESLGEDVGLERRSRLAGTG